MKRIWNTVYKRFECKNCGEEWGFKEIHECKKASLSIVDIRWAELNQAQRDNYRKEFNALSDSEYAKYDSVCDFAFYAIK